ncbi:cuticle protein 19-like [Chironomus tepperi]|uniref:cuticle protein 19-like n=1 Tax=Chironomus tepperi TaxID=113505 RepID=UPI00391F4788
MKFFVVFASIVAFAAASKLGNDYKFEVKHDYHHIPIKHEAESYVLSGQHQSVDSGAWNGDIKGDYYAYPKYKFEYGVHDPHTHDHKSQWETRDGDVVKGEYTLDEADGTKRIVKYQADDKNGFNAKVERVGHAHHEKILGSGY